MSWGDWLFLASAIGAGMFVALVAAAAVCVRIILRAVEAFNRAALFGGDSGVRLGDAGAGR